MPEIGGIIKVRFGKEKGMGGSGLNFAALYHIPDTVYAYPVNSSTLCVRLKTAKGDCRQVEVFYKNIYDHVLTPSVVKMHPVGSDEFNEWYEAFLTLPEKRFKYFFCLEDGSGKRWDYTQNRIIPHSSECREYFFYPYLFEEELVQSPEWARRGMIYQIFIDRFCNGDSGNDPKGCRQWGMAPDSRSFFGGDFKGIQDQLDYIASLGTTILYLNPIFLSDTNHKYDTVDYYSIDPAFGTLEEAKALVREAHERGIRVILDAVFNHCSSRNPFFLDVIEKKEQSLYLNWFTVYQFPISRAPLNYETFGGLVPEMPRLNSSNPDVQDYFINVASYWTKTLDIDGWRLDVADEVSHRFWKLFRCALRKIKPGLYILGEVWNRATPWLLGDEFDSVTNYTFLKNLLAFAKGALVTQNDFWNAVIKNEMNYCTNTLPYMVNLAGSHDTARILTELDGNRDLRRLVLGILFTYSGIPLLYYGDETGMEGGPDPDNRRTMCWDPAKQDQEILSFVRTLGNYRKSSEALQVGNLVKITNLPERVVGFLRTSNSQEQTVIVLANFDSFSCDVVVRPDNDFGSCTVRNLFDNRSFMADTDGAIACSMRPYDFLVLE